MPARDPHRLQRQLRGGIGEGGKDAAAMKPTRALHPEDLFPVDVSRPHLGSRAVGAVGATERGPDTEPTLGEVQPVANLVADTVVRDPVQLSAVDPALIHQVLDQPSDRIVGQGGDHRPCAGRSNA